MNLPPFRWVHRKLFSKCIGNVRAAAAHELAQVLPSLAPGSRVAVTAGSRGIARLPEILLGACDAIRSAGAEPFLVPAMGSHGGATPEGQVALLASLGVTEQSVGAPIRATMEARLIGQTASGVPAYLDRFAAEADGIVVVGRVKPHTDFEGRWESGLAKMMAVGLGKEVGATCIHGQGARRLGQTVVEAAQVMLEKAPIIAGLAVLENAVGGVWRLIALGPAEMIQREAELLAEAKAHMPRLPFPEADLLIVDYIGKDISGTGLDTKIIGRMRVVGLPEPERPRIAALAALDLTPASHGNAIGVGLADVITERLAAKIDFAALRPNTLACGFWDRAKVPVALPSDRAVILAALQGCGRPPEQARICRIRDTLRLSRMVVSEPLLPLLDGDVEVGGGYALPFDAEGHLVDHQHFPGGDGT